MLKRIFTIIVVLVIGPLMVVFLDSFLGTRSPLGGQIDIKLSHMITGGPQRFAVDVELALELFDDTCVAGTVFKQSPYSINDLFLAVGLEEDQDNNFTLPTRPLTAYAFNRPEGSGFECFVRFVSFEDIEDVIRPAFATFTETRLSEPMMDNPNAFQFTYPPLPEGVQSNRPSEPDPAMIRSFADTDDIQYFVVLRPDSFALNHILQLVVLPIAEIEAAPQGVSD